MSILLNTTLKRSRLWRLWGVGSLLLLLPSCAFFDFLQQPSTPPVTEAQLEEIQSRQWETPTEKVHKSAIFVLQGLGYQVTSDRNDKTQVEARGLVSQKQSPDICKSVWNPLLGKHVQNCRPGERYQAFRRLNLTMERIGKYTHLRLIIVSVNSRYGDKILKDNALYERIFRKLEDRLFIRETLE